MFYTNFLTEEPYFRHKKIQITLAESFTVFTQSLRNSLFSYVTQIEVILIRQNTCIRKGRKFSCIRILIPNKLILFLKYKHCTDYFPTNEILSLSK